VLEQQHGAAGGSERRVELALCGGRRSNTREVGGLFDDGAGACGVFRCGAKRRKRSRSVSDGMREASEHGFAARPFFLVFCEQAAAERRGASRLIGAERDFGERSHFEHGRARRRASEQLAGGPGIAAVEQQASARSQGPSRHPRIATAGAAEQRQGSLREYAIPGATGRFGGFYTRGIRSHFREHAQGTAELAAQPERATHGNRERLVGLTPQDQRFGGIERGSVGHARAEREGQLDRIRRGCLDGRRSTTPFQITQQKPARLGTAREGEQALDELRIADAVDPWPGSRPGADERQQEPRSIRGAEVTEVRPPGYGLCAAKLSDLSR
jgi:hypothetical protein